MNGDHQSRHSRFRVGLCGLRVGINFTNSIQTPGLDIASRRLQDQALVHMARRVIQSHCPASSTALSSYISACSSEVPGFPYRPSGPHPTPVEPRRPRSVDADNQIVQRTCLAIGATSSDGYWIGAAGSSRRIRDRFIRKKVPEAALRQ